MEGESYDEINVLCCVRFKGTSDKMDVIGNNIANVNTVAFKSQSVTFSDVYYQTTQTATGPNTETGAGGTNPMQIGTGSSVASISTAITTQGASERTDSPYDYRFQEMHSLL